MLQIVPAQEVWETKAIKRANRRKTVAAMMAEMPPQEEWEKKVSNRRGGGPSDFSTSLSTFVPTSPVAEKEVEVEVEVEEEETPVPIPEPEGPLTAKQLKIRRMKAAFSAVVATNNLSSGLTSPSRGDVKVIAQREANSTRSTT